MLQLSAHQVLVDEARQVSTLQDRVVGAAVGMEVAPGKNVMPHLVARNGGLEDVVQTDQKDIILLRL